MDDAGDQGARSRLRLAAERLYDDTRLRDALDDDQAERLLSWGYNEIARTLAELPASEPEASDTQVEESTVTVREVIVRVNRLMDGYQQSSAAQRREQMARLVEWLCRVHLRRLQVGDLVRLEALSAAAGSLSRQEFFASLLALVAGEEEE
jgi:hypothetical protein